MSRRAYGLATLVVLAACSASTVGLGDGAPGMEGVTSSGGSESGGGELPTATGAAETGTADGGGAAGSTGEPGPQLTMPIDPEVCLVPDAACDAACLSECEGAACAGEVRAARYLYTGLVNLTGVTISPEGEIVTAGVYAGSPDFGLGPLPTATEAMPGSFIVRYAADGAASHQATLPEIIVPRLIAMPGGRTLVLITDMDTYTDEIWHFLPDGTLTPIATMPGVMLDSAVSFARNEVYMIGRCNVGSTDDALFARFNGMTLVSHCMPDGDTNPRLETIAVLPDGELAVAGYVVEDFPAFGFDVPDDYNALAGFLIRFGDDFDESGIDISAANLFLSVSDWVGIDGTNFKQLAWNGRHIIAAGTMQDAVDFGLSDPITTEGTEVFIAAFDRETLETQQVLLPNLRDVLDIVADCAGNVVIGSVIGKEYYPYDGPDLPSDKAAALLVAKFHSADAPLAGYAWTVADSGVALSEYSSSQPFAIAASADRVVVIGGAGEGEVILSPEVSLPTVEPMTFGTFMVEITP